MFLKEKTDNGNYKHLVQGKLFFLGTFDPLKMSFAYIFSCKKWPSTWFTSYIDITPKQS